MPPRGAGPGRHVHLGLNPGHGDLRDLADLRGQRAVGDQEDIRGETSSLLHRFHVGHHSGDLHGRLARQLPAGHDHVVKLEVLAGRQPDGELQGRRGHRSYHQPDWLLRCGRAQRAQRGDPGRLTVAELRRLWFPHLTPSPLMTSCPGAYVRGRTLSGPLAHLARKADRLVAEHAVPAACIRLVGRDSVTRKGC